MDNLIVLHDIHGIRLIVSLREFIQMVSLITALILPALDLGSICRMYMAVI